MRGFKGLGLCLGMGVVATSSWSATARAEETHLRTTLESKGERQALGRALAGAVRWPERPGCQRIFREFKDVSGRTLQEGDAVGQDGASYLQGWVVFADGQHETRCADTRVLAFTQPGSRSVWICGRRFAWEQRKDPAYAEVVLIHEALHVLGLGKNPPSAATISRQVEARCGS